MKKLILYMFFMLTAGIIYGQAEPAGKPFYFIGSKTLYKMTVSPDTLVIYQCTSIYIHTESRVESLYKILDTVSQRGFRVYYVEVLVQLSVPENPPKRFRSIAVRYGENGQVAEMLSESDDYASLAKCKEQPLIDPDSKFLITYFSEQKLQTLISYRSVADLDSAAVDKLLLTFKKEMETNKEKIMNTKGTYGSLIGREMINRAMIQLRINPFASEEELDKKLRNSPVAKEMGGT